MDILSRAQKWIPVFVILLGPIAAGSETAQPEKPFEEMNPAEQHEVLLQLYNRGTITPKTWKDVLANDEQRERNLRETVTDENCLVATWPAYYSIPRPQTENDVLLAALEEGLKKAQLNDYEVFDKALKPFTLSRFCSKDERIGELLREFLSSDEYPKGFPWMATMCPTLRALGRIHLDASAEFLKKARWKSFWRSMPSVGELPEEHKPAAECLFGNAATEGIGHLPLDTAIPLLEEMYDTLAPDDSRRWFVLTNLDRLWQQKLGRFQDRMKEQVMPWGWGKTTDLHPKWLYGPGGTPIEKPFGDDPEIERTRQELRRMVENGVIDISLEEAYRIHGVAEEDDTGKEGAD